MNWKFWREKKPRHRHSWQQYGTKYRDSQLAHPEYMVKCSCGEVGWMHETSMGTLYGWATSSPQSKAAKAANIEAAMHNFFR